MKVQKPYQKRSELREQPLPETRLGSFLLQLALVDLKARFEGVFHACRGVGGTADGINFLADGFLDGEAVPGFVEATVGEVWGR